MSAESHPVAKTRSGLLAGAPDADGIAFKAIPYACPPVGALRFSPPQPEHPWEGIRAAREYGPHAVQTNSDVENLISSEIIQLANYRPETHPISEDCLYLNVWTPALDGGKRPVMVWLHGGGFYTGSGSDERTDGARLSKYGDVVVVSLNHRLGILGFLHLSDLVPGEFPYAGNLGLLDIQAALEWVQENIASFGGDPGNVTVFGCSGGGGKVCALMCMPKARGLFHRAIVQSGPWARYRTREDASAVASAVLEELGIDAGQTGKLRSLAIEDLSRAQSVVMKQLLTRPFPRDGAMTDCHFGPVCDGSVLPFQTLEQGGLEISADVPLLIGTTKDEATYLLTCDPEVFSLSEEGMSRRLVHTFGADADALASLYRRARPDATPTDLYFAINTDYLVRNGSIRIAERKSEVPGAKVFMYMFTYETSVLGGKLKSHHGLDSPFIFNKVGTDPFSGTDPGRFRLGEIVCRTWATFARLGDPNHPGLPFWPEYETAARDTMMLNVDCRVVADPQKAERLAWQRY